MKKILIKIYKFMTRIISKFRNSLTGEEYQIGAGEGGGATDPAIVEQIYADLRKEITDGDSNLHGEIEQLNTNLRNEIENTKTNLQEEITDTKTNLQEEIKRNEVPLYTDKTIDEVKEMLGDDINIGKTVAVVENDRVVEYCWQPVLSESIKFYHEGMGEYVIAIRSMANDIKGEYDRVYYAWVNGDIRYYTNSSDDTVSIKTDAGMLQVAPIYEIVKTAGFVRKTVFYYENESAVAYINGNEVMRITADGSLRLSDGNGFTATISPRQLAALVATIN